MNEHDQESNDRHPERIVLRAHPGMLCGTDGEIFLRLEGELHRLQGRQAPHVVATILHLIDGRSTEDEIVSRACRQNVSAEWAAQALRWLVEEGLCVRDRGVDADRPRLAAYEPQIRYFTAHASMPTDTQDRLREGRVTVIGLEHLGSLLVQQLALAGVGRVTGVGPSALTPAESVLIAAPPADRHQALSCWIRDHGLATRYRGIQTEAHGPLDWEAPLAGCDLAVLIAPRPAVRTLARFNQAALHANIRFLPLVLDGAAAAIGPLVVPEETACLTCRELRRSRPAAAEAFRDLQNAQAESDGLAWRDEAFLFAHLSVLAAMTAAEIVIALAGSREPAILGRELLVDAHGWRVQVAPVLRVPRCWDCGRMRRFPPSRPFGLGGASVERDATER